MRSFPNALGLQLYSDYLRSFQHWAENSLSSMTDAPPAIVEFTRLNWVRTQRLHKTIVLADDLITKIQSLQHQYSWLVLTEAWCGDSAQNLPYIAELMKEAPAEQSLHILLRDQNRDLMNQYLTNGSRAIPKLVVIDETTRQEVLVWGPRPQPAQEIVLEWKKDPRGRSWDQLEKELHTWYAKDKGQTIQKELEEILDQLKAQERNVEYLNNENERLTVSNRA